MQFLFDVAFAATILLAAGIWAANRRQRAASQKTAAVLEGITDSFFVLDSQGRFTHMSSQTGELLGRRCTDVIGKPFAEAFKDAASDFHVQVARGMRNRTAARFEHFHEQVKRRFEHRIFINSDGGISVYGRDITAQEQLEDALRISQERYRGLVDSNVIGVFVTVGESITEGNDHFLAMLDYTRDELVRQQLQGMHIGTPEQLSTDPGAERELVKKGGERIPVWMTAMQIGQETLYVVHDLTHRKRAENRLRHLVEATRILSASLDSDRMLAELARFLSTSIGESCVIHLKEDSEIRQAAAASRQGGHDDLDLTQLPQMRMVLTKGAPEILPNRGVMVPLPSRGRIAGTLFVGRSKGAFDADDLHVLEEIGRRAGISIENTRLYQQTEVGSRLKDEFVSVLSHELRTPLTPILGAVYMLRSEPDDKRIFTKALDLIERNAKHQARMVEDLLDVSRIISGKLRLRQEPVDLEGPIRAAVETVRAACEGKNIQLQVSLQSLNAPAYGDEDRLQQIFWNILSNSAKFTPNGGRIAVELLQTGDHAEIRVVDTGMGIGAEFLPFVFDRFRQGDSSRTRMHGGLGIGLAIVRHLVESHGGTVHVHSAGDQMGCTFVVKLPLRGLSQTAAGG